MDTYESTNYKLKFERIEWDDFWFEQTADKEKTRVLYIGDSISRQIRNVATKESGYTILFDNYSTSKALDNPFFFEGIKYYAKQEEKRDIVLFNNGLHGWHLEDTTDYRDLMEKTAEFLKEEFKTTPIAIVLTTYITKEGVERVIERNKAASDIAKKYNFHVIDLYTTAFENKELIRDGIHFTDEGAVRIAQKVINDIKEILK